MDMINQIIDFITGHLAMILTNALLALVVTQGQMCSDSNAYKPLQYWYTLH